jgi:BirA family biotin operon repressor/biotin-[acetyl-CoA-carboxylase] ligase
MYHKRLEPNFIHLESVDSTNNYAANLLKESKPVNGTTILTKRQTAGKGQRGNSWQAETGLNLTFSMIVYPDLTAKQVFYLNIIASLAVSRALELYTSKVSIKWPNDVYVGNLKIAGILVENQFRGDHVVSSILGIGINVNQQHFDENIHATSLRLLKGEDSSLDTVFHDCYKQLDFYLDLLMEKNFQLLSKLYHNQLLGINESLKFNDANGDFEGVIQGVDEDGKLKIKRADGIKKYDLKEVRFLF